MLKTGGPPANETTDDATADDTATEAGAHSLVMGSVALLALAASQI